MKTPPTSLNCHHHYVINLTMWLTSFWLLIENYIIFAILEKLELIAVPTPNGSIRAMSVSDEFNELDPSMTSNDHSVTSIWPYMTSNTADLNLNSAVDSIFYGDDKGCIHLVELSLNDLALRPIKSEEEDGFIINFLRYVISIDRNFTLTRAAPTCREIQLKKKMEKLNTVKEGAASVKIKVWSIFIEYHFVSNEIQFGPASKSIFYNDRSSFWLGYTCSVHTDITNRDQGQI